MKNRLARTLMDFGYWIADVGFKMQDEPAGRRWAVPVADRGDDLDFDWETPRGENPV